VKFVLVTCALLLAACAPSSDGSDNPTAGGSGGAAAGAGGAGGRGGATGGSSAGGAPGTGGSAATGGAGAGSGGVGGAGRGGTGGAATSSGGTGAAGSGGGAGSGSEPSTGGTGGSPADGPAPDAPANTPPTGGGKALLVTGTIPLVGTDVVFEAAFKARGLEVEVVQEREATPMHAEGKRVIMLSYGMTSTAFKAEAFTDVPVPIIVTEQNLLPRLKLSAAHGFTGKMTKLTFVSDHELAASFPMGDLEVYSPSQEFFWGTPSPAGIRIAHLVGQPNRVTYFAYEKGAMMDGAVAPAKRVQFFHATHSPDPIDRNLYLNANGLKLLGATIDWCLK
jgi:hypothetical protein